LKTESCN